MKDSLTEQETVALASNEPTSQEQQSQVSAENNQEANSREQSQESVTDTTAQTNQQNAEQKQTNKQGGSNVETDDGLAKFAKSQGIEDFSQLSEREVQFLKIAHDNQKAFREKGSQPSISDATKGLSGDGLEARLAQLENEKATDKFFSENRDRSLEPKMVDILNEKREQYGDEYALNLSRDLDTLYGLAQISSGVTAVDVEAIRREERESINRQMSGSAPTTHATQGQRQSVAKIDQAWIRNSYDPKNPEHRAMVDEFYGR